jgi:hypothetical protein
MPDWVYDKMLDQYYLCTDGEGEEVRDYPTHRSVNFAPACYRVDEESGVKYYDYDVPKSYSSETLDGISLEWRRMVETAKLDERLHRPSFDSQESFETYTFHWLGFHSMKCVNYWYNKKAKHLELAVKELFESLMFDVSRLGNPNDGGIDLKATKGKFEIFIQCKGLGKNMGVGPVREAIGIKNNYMTNFAIVCPIGFSGYAKSLARDNNIVLFDAHKLGDLARGEINSLQSANIISLGKR